MPICPKTEERFLAGTWQTFLSWFFLKWETKSTTHKNMG